MDQEKQTLTDEQVNNEEQLQEETNNDDTQRKEEVKVEQTEDQQRMDQLQEEVSILQDRLLRVQADYDNFRKRSRQEKETDAKYRAQSLIEDIIPVIDNFDRALSVQVESEEAKALLQGVEMVYRQLLEALKTEGLQLIEATGKPFDPNYHQAVMQVESEEYESNQVIEEFQKGYMLKDRVIRPTMVKVCQ